MLDAPHGEARGILLLSGSPVRREHDSRTLVGSRALGQYWPLAHHGTAHAFADLRGIQIELRQSPAQSVPMHAKLCRSLALIALVVCQHFEDVAPLELPNRIRIGNAGTVHLRY